MAERDEEDIKHHETGALPAVESPPLSPAGFSSEPTDDTEDEAAVAAAATSRSRFSLSRRNQRRATLAVWLALVAGFGAVFGSAVSNGLAGHGRADFVQREAMQRSIDQLTKQVSALKVSLAKATAATRTQIAKISTHGGSDITGSIPTAQVKPVPLPRPAPRISAPISRPAVIHSWRILRSRGDVIAVEGRNGIYEVVPGAVLPGLGPVQSIERQAGRWMVVTPKGIIVSSRDRGYFEDF